MATAIETKLKESFSFNSILIFYEWTYTKFLTPWPKFDYQAVLTETTDEKFFILLSDINLLVRETCGEYT